MGIPFPFLLFLSSNHIEVSGAGWGGSHRKWQQTQMLSAAHLETEGLEPSLTFSKHNFPRAQPKSKCRLLDQQSDKIHQKNVFLLVQGET